MFDKVSQMAEQVATKASRREFLGHVGRGAMVMAAALGGLLALPETSHGAKPPPKACGPSSSGSCQGANVGDTCYEEVTGSCATAPGSKTGDCFCSFKGPHPR